MRIPSVVALVVFWSLVGCGDAKAPPALGGPPGTGTPGSPAGQCIEAPAPRSADLAGCKAKCQGLSDGIPTGSACISPRHTCVMNCEAKFSPPPAG